MCCNGKHWSGCSVRMATKVLLIIGGLNWGLIGLGMLLDNSLNVVAMLLGKWPLAEAIVYLLVGVAAVMMLFGCCCKKCRELCGNCGDKGMGGDMSQKM